jgi:hypothetical protein
MRRTWPGRALRWYIVSILFCGGAHPALAESPKWKITQSITFESGKFGTETRSNSLYVPLTLKRYLKKGEISLTVPYVFVETNGLVTIVGGVPGQTRPQFGPAITIADAGIGDLILRGGYYILEEDPGLFDLTLIGRVKFPTADEKKGLGTGEFDETLGLESSKRIKKRWVFFVDFYYTFIGDPPGTTLDDRIAYDVGISYQPFYELTLSFFYDESTSLLERHSPPRDIMQYAEYKATKKIRLFVYGLLGLSDGSSAWGGGGGASLRF